MYEEGMRYLYTLLYRSELQSILAENVVNGEMLSNNGQIYITRPAIYDGRQPDNAVMPFVTITPNILPSQFFGLERVNLSFDIFTQDGSTLKAMRIYEIITNEIEMLRIGDIRIYRFYYNNDLMQVPEEERSEVTHFSFSITMKYIRKGYYDK